MGTKEARCVVALRRDSSPEEGAYREKSSFESPIDIENGNHQLDGTLPNWAMRGDVRPLPRSAPCALVRTSGVQRNSRESAERAGGGPQNVLAGLPPPEAPARRAATYGRRGARAPPCCT